LRARATTSIVAADLADAMVRSTVGVVYTGLTQEAGFVSVGSISAVDVCHGTGIEKRSVNFSRVRTTFGTMRSDIVAPVLCCDAVLGAPTHREEDAAGRDDSYEEAIHRGKQRHGRSLKLNTVRLVG
jgi:hypothetical protein